MTAQNEIKDVSMENLGESPAPGMYIHKKPNSKWMLRKRLKVLLATAGLLAAALVSLSSSGGGQADAYAAGAADPTAPTASLIAPPPADTKVFKQAMPMYHWRKDCPLADAVSIRTGTKTAASHRVWMSRLEAEKRTLMPCTYCADLDQK